LNFACKSDVDWLALSFVQKHQDMVELRQLVREAQGHRPKLIAKIEKPSAVDDLELILQHSDGVMVEASERQPNTIRTSSPILELGDSNAVVASAATLAKGVGARAIVCFTATGRSVQRLVQLRPGVPILAICPCLETARWLSLLHGVYATSDADVQSLAARVQREGVYSVRFTEGLEAACRLGREKGLATAEDDRLVVVARLPLFTKGVLNTIRLAGAMGPMAADGYGPDKQDPKLLEAGSNCD